MKMLNKLGYSKVEVLIVVVLLGVVAFITINKTSYAFAIDNNSVVDEIKNLIEVRAEDYGMAHPEIFRESNEYVITVSELIDEHYIEGNSEGVLVNPTDTSKNFNDIKVRLTYDNYEVVSKIIN